jgi:hypothetical protein
VLQTTLRRMETSDLTDAQWKRLRPVLPPQKPRVDSPANDHRTALNGILWVLRTGSPWRCLPERFGSSLTGFSGPAMMPVNGANRTDNGRSASSLDCATTMCGQLWDATDQAPLSRLQCTGENR